jgi:acyl dehydratase
MAEEIPGPGTIYLGQTLNSLAPVYVDDEATATVEVIHIRPDKPIVTLRTVVTTGNGPVIMGEAVVKAPSGKSDSPA